MSDSQNFKETWTVTQPPPAFDRPSWERTGPTITREVEGFGYQPHIGGYDGVQYSSPVLGYSSGGGGGLAMTNTMTPRLLGYMESLRAETVGGYGRLTQPPPQRPLRTFDPAPQGPAGILREQIRVKTLELELQALEAQTTAPPPGEFHAATSVGPIFAALLLAFLFAGVGLMVGKIRAPRSAAGQPEQRTSRPSDPLDADL